MVKRRRRNSEQVPEEDAQSEAPPQKRLRKRETEHHHDVAPQPVHGAPISNVGLPPGPEPREPAPDFPTDTPHNSRMLSASGGGRRVATAPPGKGRKAAMGPPRGYPHVMGPCGFPPSSEPMQDSLTAHLLARGLVPLTEAILAACDYSDKTGFHPPCGHVSPVRSSVTDRSPLIVEPTPWYSYTMRPRWLVDSPLVDSVAPLLETLTPKTILRIFDEADPRDVDRFLQLCLHLDDESLLPSPFPPVFEGLGDHPYRGVLQDSSTTGRRCFSEGIQDAHPVLSASTSLSAVYRSLDDLQDLDWLTSPASSYSNPSIASEMPALAYQGNWNTPYGALSAPDARGRARWPIPPAFPFSPRSEAAFILAELASGQTGTHAATRMDMRRTAGPPSDMTRLSTSDFNAEHRQSRQDESGMRHWHLPPSCEGQFE